MKLCPQINNPPINVTAKDDNTVQKILNQQKGIEILDLFMKEILHE